MSIPYSPPTFRSDGFNCPFCGAYAKQDWYTAGYGDDIYGRGDLHTRAYAEHIALARCTRCAKDAVWVDEVMVYPNGGSAPLPNPDPPEDIKNDYEEARSILSASPRGAAALLRLSIQKLCKELKEKGKNINEDIASLVQKGLPVRVQQALDTVRVIGNDAVHPGTIDLNDTPDIAAKLFVLVNIIVDNQITQPKMIDELYSSLPADKLRGIQQRDTPKI